jgi:hypothetical protein
MRLVRTGAAWLAALTVALAACASPPPAPRPTAPPTIAPAPAFKPKPVPTPSPTPAEVPDLGEDPDETVMVYLDSLFQVLDEMSVMAEASCDELKQALKENPNVFRSVRGFGASLKRVAAQSAGLSQDEEVAATLAELDVTMGQLDGALSLCGISLN